jgi:ribonucleoside-diphosphate reductase alpha chain
MDIFEFLSIKSELDGDLRDKAFDIFPQIVIDSYFADAVHENKDVYLFNQYEFQQKTGIDITELIEDDLKNAIQLAQVLAASGKISSKKVPAKKVWKKALWSWIEIGDFYITHKDMLNFSNYMKYDKEDGGVAKCGNLCVESFSFSKLPAEWEEKSSLEKRETIKTNGLYHSCSLISISLPKFIKNPEKLPEVCFYATYMLDKSIDMGEMPVLEAKESSQKIRNIGIGMVGMADYLAYNKVMFNTEEGLETAESITELISYHCYKSSIELAKTFGPYPAFKSENYKKLLGRDPEELNKLSPNGLDWVGVQKEILRHGIRNMLINAVAPNTTSGIMMGTTASYLPVYNKDMTQTLSDMVVTILPMFIKERYWYYKTKFQYNPVEIIQFTRRIQRWIDTGISMEININPDISNIAEISDEIIDGFRSKELKAVYYSSTIGREHSDGCADCSN